MKCNTSDLAFDECLRAGLQSAIPHLAMGNNIQTDKSYFKIFDLIYFFIKIFYRHNYIMMLLFRYP